MACETVRFTGLLSHSISAWESHQPLGKNGRLSLYSVYLGARSGGAESTSTTGLGLTDAPNLKACSS